MLGVSNGVVHGYVRRARLAGLTWPLPEGLDDEGLELLLFPAPTAASQSDRRPAPDWVYMEKELRRLSVTRLLLWEYHLLKILFFPGRDAPQFDNSISLFDWTRDLFRDAAA
jgi:hypothetical protein